jgi:hypothetical protein
MSTRLSFEFVIGGKLKRSESGTWGSTVTRLIRYTPMDLQCCRETAFCWPRGYGIAHGSLSHHPSLPHPRTPIHPVPAGPKQKKRKFHEAHPHSLRVSPTDRRKWSAADRDPENFSTVTSILPPRASRETVAGAAAKDKETI